MKLFNNLHLNIKLVFIITILQKSSNSMFYPFMAIFISNYYDLKITSIILFIISCFSIVANLLGGHFAGYFGNKNILLVSEITKLASFIILVLTLIQYNTYSIIIAVLLINNFCSSLSNPINQTIMIQYSHESNRKKIYTLSYWILNLSVSIGTIIGAYLFQEYILFVFGAIITLSFINCTLIYLIKENTQKNQTPFQEVSGLKNFIHGYKSVLKNKNFMIFVFATLLFIGIESQFTNFISIHISNSFNGKEIFNITVDKVEIVGYIRVLNTIIIIIFTTLILKITSFIQTKYQIVIGTLLFTIGSTMLLINSNFWFLILATVIFSLGEIMYGPPSQIILSKLAEGPNTSRFLAFENLIVKGSILLGALGVFLGSFSSIYVLLYIICLGVMSIIFYSIVLKSNISSFQ